MDSQHEHQYLDYGAEGGVHCPCGAVPPSANPEPAQPQEAETVEVPHTEWTDEAAATAQPEEVVPAGNSAEVVTQDEQLPKTTLGDIITQLNQVVEALVTFKNDSNLS